MTPSTRRLPADPSSLGLTLIEVMVGLLLFAILALGAFGAFSVQQSTSTFQQKSESTVDSARSLLNVMAMQARAAKGGAPEGHVLLNNQGTIPSIPVNCRASPQFEIPIVHVSAGLNGTDVLRILFPEGTAWGQSVDALDNAASHISFRTTGFRPALAQNDWLLVSNFDPLPTPAVARVAILYQATNPLADDSSCGGSPLDWCISKTGAAGGYPIPASPPPPGALGAFVIKARWLQYAINASGQMIVTDLFTGNSEPAAEAVDDLQVALGYDTDKDKAIPHDTSPATNDEWIGNIAGDSFPVAGQPNICALRDLRAIRISLVVRATAETPEARSTRPALEDHAVGSVDRYYRVTVRSIIALR